MTISPSELMPFVEEGQLSHRPYSEKNTEDWNMKGREVYCANCVYRTRTMLPHPHCGMCHCPLYVVVKSHVTETQNELGRPDSSSA